MLFKQLAISMAAIAAIGASAIALADDSNYSNAAVATSHDHGFYLRGQAGYDWAATASKTLPFQTDSTSIVLNPPVQVSSSKKSGITGRVGVGYDINSYFGVEAGFSMYSPVSRQVGTAAFQNGAVAVLTGASTVKTTSLFAADLLGKVTIPFDRFFAFVQGGGAYVHAHNNSLSVNVTSQAPALAPVSENVTVWNSSSKSYFRPEVGAGVGYNVTDAVGVDVSYTRIFGKDNVADQNYLPSLNAALVGLTYKF